MIRCQHSSHWLSEPHLHGICSWFCFTVSEREGAACKSHEAISEYMHVQNSCPLKEAFFLSHFERFTTSPPRWTFLTAEKGVNYSWEGPISRRKMSSFQSQKWGKVRAQVKWVLPALITVQQNSLQLEKIVTSRVLSEFCRWMCTEIIFGLVAFLPLWWRREELLLSVEINSIVLLGDVSDNDMS